MRLDSVQVVGWSDGGIIGLLLTIRHPEKVRKLVITGANLQPDTTAVDPLMVKRVTKTGAMLDGWFQEARPKTPRDSMVYKYVKLLRDQPHIALTDLHKINVPTLVIGGDHDVIRTRHTLLIAEHIRQSYLWILPNSRHSTLVAYTEEFNEKV
jgi:pimeloyl-ACP methyl ester carboxylesterase